jgi:predicted HTH transcriptional regulator
VYGFHSICSFSLPKYELPTDSVRELIANAVAHRSYLEPGNIQVAIFDDRLEVTSPGMLLNNVSIKKMIEGYSKPRNPAIANAFAYMKIIEKWGTGIPRIFRECRDYGLPDPELIDFDGDFRVNMYRNNTNKASNESINESISESLNSDEAVIMDIIKSNPQISQKEMVTKSGFSRSKIQRILKVLQGKKVLYREGARKNGYWKIL